MASKAPQPSPEGDKPSRRKKASPARSSAQPQGERIVDMDVTDEMRQSFLEYSMSVIVARALPDVRDGLKPVHRRILYTMHKQGLRPNVAHSKCARIVGGVMGSLHPHGDSAIYEALVRLAQPWSMRLPLVDGHGNFGSLDDGPAAARYCVVGDTLVRLADGRTETIENLARRAGAAPNSTVSVDLDLVGARGESVHASAIHHSGTHPTVRLASRRGYSLTGTGNHPVVVLRADADGRPHLAWATLGEIEAGDWVALARFAHEPLAGDEPGGAETQLGVLAGMFVSEGWYNRRAGFNNTDETYFAAALRAYDTIIGGRRDVHRRTVGSGKTIFECDIQDTTQLDRSPLSSEKGLRSAGKRIPAAIWSAGPAAKRAFLSSVFEGDGTVAAQLGRRGNSVRIAYSTRSERLAKDIQVLLLEFGIASSVHCGRRDEWVLTIGSPRDVRLFCDRVGFFSAKQTTLRRSLDSLTDRDTYTSTKAALSADPIPYLRHDVLPQTRAPHERAKGAAGHKWLTKRTFGRAERFERHGEMIAAHLDERLGAYVAECFNAGYLFDEVASVSPAGAHPVFSFRVDTSEHAFVAGGFVNHNTEARMSAAALVLCEELGEDTVDFKANYDGTETEPTVLPAGLPNLLVNGATGIAVGMATNMAPHNLAEVAAGLIAMLDNPKITLAELMRHIPGPDFPSGAVIYDRDAIKEAYASGRGSIRMRAVTSIEQISNRRQGIVVTELPYTVGPERVIAKVKELVGAKKLAGVADIKDLSDRVVGLKLVIDVKSGFDPQAVLAELYRLTPLEETFGVNNVALVGGEPRTLTLVELCHHYLEHRVVVVRRRTSYRLERARARAHIVEGLVVALANIDEVVALLKASKDPDVARQKLTRRFKLSDIQANHILEMPLRRLTSLEITKLKDELRELKRLIAELEKLLASDKKLRALVGEELGRVAEAYGTPRRSRILTKSPAGDLAVMPRAPGAGPAALQIADDPCLVCVTSNGLIGRYPAATAAGRHAKGDLVVAQLRTSNRATIGAITDRGRLLRVPVVELPPSDHKNRGGAAGEFLDLAAGERVVALAAVTDSVITLGTAQGVVKRLEAAALPKTNGTIIALKDDDRVVGGRSLPAGDAENAEFVFVTDDAQLLRAGCAQVRPQGASAAGMAGVRLADGASVVAFAVVAAGEHAAVHTATDTATVKSSAFADYPAKGRGTGGVRVTTFRKADSRLVAAAISDGDVWGVGPSGESVALPAQRLRRDAAGEVLDTPVASFAVARPAV